MIGLSQQLSKLRSPTIHLPNEVTDVNDFRHFPYYRSPRFLDRSTLYTSAAVQINREKTPPAQHCANEHYFRFGIRHLENGQRATGRSRNSQPLRNLSTNNRDVNDFRNFPYYRSPPFFDRFTL